MNAASLAVWRRWSLEVRRATWRLWLLLPLLALPACTDRGFLEPATRTPFGHAAVTVTPNYSAFDTRSEFNAVGGIDHLSSFEEFTGDLVYKLPTPWTTNGVTYTSELNLVLGPGIGLGVSSNSVSTEFGAPLTGQLAAADAFTLFGADVTIIGEKVPVDLVISTNLGNYTLGALDIPLATSGRRFVGVALSQPGEYLTGFQLTIQGPNTELVLDNVAVGHVAAVQNADPAATAGGSYTGLEGSAVALSLGGTDPDGDALTFSWDLGDGTTGSGATPPASHTYADNGSYAIVLAVADGRGGVDTARTMATIANVAPVLAPFSVPDAAVALISAGVTVQLSATFTDPGADTHTATLDCGVGDVTPALAETSTPNGTVSGTCSFSSAGVYSVRLTVRDDDGASDTEVAAGNVVVYDPSGGWVTGGGWVASPVGAYAGAPLAGGKLTFGLLARYEAGATVPSGIAEFKLTEANFDFRGTSFDWMTIAGSTVQLQGRGRLNGAGDYVFRVTGQDRVSNATILRLVSALFRQKVLVEDQSLSLSEIRIWDRVTGAVVYDNAPGESIASDPGAVISGGGLQVRRQ